jgi:signal transduction histidine kinase
MSIRTKIACTFILLLIFGITAISSYSILFIRNYLLDEGENQIINDTEWLAITIENMQVNAEFETNLNEAALTSGYRVAVYDEGGNLFADVPYSESLQAEQSISREIEASILSQNTPHLVSDEESEELIAYTDISADNNPSRYLRVSIFMDQIYEPIKTIRWIIYTGMFISIALVLLVSVWFSRYLSKPISQLESAAREIAGGNTDQTLNLDRNDEFGKLAHSLNQMAERLRADNAELKRLYERQNQFFADISHEIRNPLHTVAGSIEMLQMDKLTDEMKQKYLLTAERQTQRISRLFQDLVTLQKYDSDNKFIQQKTFNIQSAIQLIAELHELSAQEKGINLTYDNDPVNVMGDPDKIEQVLENLLTNAIKFTNEGEINISVRSDETDVIVEVADTGIGITNDHLDRLFDRFYRTDKARSRDKGGTGLGLAVVKSILHAHQSEIHVESEPGKGSRFWFRLKKA